MPTAPAPANSSATLPPMPPPGPAPSAGTQAVKLTPEQERERDRQVYRRLFNKPEDKAGAQTPPASPPNVASGQPPIPKPSSDDGSNRRELVEIANAVLRRDGLPDKARETMIGSLSDAELTAMVEHRRKIQADQDRLGNEVAEMRRRGSKEPAPKPPDQETGTDDLADLTERQRSVIAKLRGEGDDERAGELLAAFRDGRSSTAPQRDVPSAGPSDLSPDERARVIEDRLLVRLRAPLDQLSSDFSALKSDEGRRKLLQTADRLTGSGVFDKNTSAEDLLRKSASVAFGFPTHLDAQKQLARTNATERLGMPDTTTNANRASGQSPKDRDRRAYQLLQKGHTADEVKRMLESDE